MTKPPPLPQRPKSATNESKQQNREEEKNINNLINNSTNEIFVKDAVHVENKHKNIVNNISPIENEKRTEEIKQTTTIIPPTTLNLKTLEEMLPSNNNNLSATSEIQKHFLYQATFCFVYKFNFLFRNNFWRLLYLVRKIFL